MIKPEEINESSRLIEKQWLLAYLLPKLINKAYELGHEVTLGDAYRDPRVFGVIGESRGYGHPRSAHKGRLAVDINLFKFGIYLEKTGSHYDLGQFWKNLHPLCRWGGDFKTPDGNHYSIEHGGVM